ncbi:MAG: prepilin peptidase [Actinomycetota bacterium]
MYADVVLPGTVGLGLGALVPLLSRPWCACGRRTSVITALVGAALFVAMAERFATWNAVIAYCVLCFGLLVSTTIDIRVHRLPREISYGTMALGAPWLVWATATTGEPWRLRSALVGAGLALFVMMGLHFLSRGGLGDGDVRFGPLLGMFSGWLGVPVVVDALLVGFASGAVWGSTLLIIRRAGRKTAIPFGPFLAWGVIVAVMLPRRLAWQ